MPLATELVRLEHVTRRFGDGREAVLDGVSFVLPRGEYVAIVGESGVGKSTLLNVIAGLERVDAGTVTVDGVALTGLADEAASRFRRERLGFVFQAFHVLSYLNVLDNVALPLALNGVRASERRSRARSALDEVGLLARAQDSTATLSGGEVQRVAIARAIVHRPALVLADEPTGNLDPRAAEQVLLVLRRAISASGGGGLLITHSAAAARTADRIYRFDGHQLELTSLP